MPINANELGSLHSHHLPATTILTLTPYSLWPQHITEICSMVKLLRVGVCTMNERRSFCMCAWCVCVFVYLLKLLFVCLLFLLVRMPHIRAYERFNGKPLVEYVRITKQIVNKSWRFHVTVLCLSLKTNWQRKSAVSTIESDFICFGFGMRFDQWYTYIKPYQEFSNWFFFSMMLFSQKPFILFKQTLIWKPM